MRTEPVVAIVAFEDGQTLDVTGPHEVFSQVRRIEDRALKPTSGGYRVEVLGERGGFVTMSSGLRLAIDRPFSAVRSPPDTLLVSGGRGAKRRGNSPALIAWLQRMAPRVRRIGSICTGAFVLAEAGLLDGRRATTHWESCAALAREYPKVTVEPDPIFIRSGRVSTSAGVTAGIDLALALVEEDWGYRVALQIARELVLFLKRPGGQSQFSAQLQVQSATTEPLRELEAWLADHLGEPLDVPRLARQVAMSPRNFGRVFRRETGVTPAHFVERLRVEAAIHHLTESSRGLDSIASVCGFGSPETMRRAFLRQLGAPPGQYRSRFVGKPRLRRVQG